MKISVNGVESAQPFEIVSRTTQLFSSTVPLVAATPTNFSIPLLGSQGTFLTILNSDAANPITAATYGETADGVTFVDNMTVNAALAAALPLTFGMAMSVTLGLTGALSGRLVLTSAAGVTAVTVAGRGTSL